MGAVVEWRRTAVPARHTAIINLPTTLHRHELKFTLARSQMQLCHLPYTPSIFRSLLFNSLVDHIASCVDIDARKVTNYFKRTIPD